MKRTIQISVICTPHADHDVTFDTISTNSKGHPATSAQLYNMIMKQLTAGVCIFVYVVKDGGYRTAIGTLNTALIPGNPTAKAIDPNNPTQTYYDLEKVGYRDFTKNNVIAIISL